ncbi:S-adenosyl-L-methionine-dependent methyltransferase [Tribonema minus]|uniref:S-adenosyl-L-methionine-dependent methyltransferase n=1 Tax=Tribonema minus TaxID=303371 RepID=A0A835ZGE3_9STRA|nr:S-adenosyl-L-methionine-dependent methyltransferase [Tribonema minus]
MFVPPRHGVPSYFLPMLNDVDRNSSYEQAIRDTLLDFNVRQGRPPAVLDVGASTGMLSMMALKHGASSVTLVEANRTLLDLAEEHIRHGFPDAHATYKCCVSSDLKATEGVYDMIVCELVGSMLNSESMSSYLAQIIKRGLLRSFEGRYYVVPQRGVMTARIYDCPAAVGLTTGIETPRCSSFTLQCTTAPHRKKSSGLKTRASGFASHRANAPLSVIL